MFDRPATPAIVDTAQPLMQLFQGIASLQSNCGMRCLREGGCSGACCYVSKMGGEPNLTASEVDLINSHLKTLNNFTFYDSGTDACKFLGADNKCKIYAVRPIDCRTHFCDGEVMTSQAHDGVDDLVHAYHQRHEASFYNSELMYACRFHLEPEI